MVQIESVQSGDPLYFFGAQVGLVGKCIFDERCILRSIVSHIADKNIENWKKKSTNRNLREQVWTYFCLFSNISNLVQKLVIAFLCTGVNNFD